MIVPLVYPFRMIILANGAFPQHHVPLIFLREAECRVCCDGATETLLLYGLEPDYIVGDMDSLSPEVRRRYTHCLHHNPDQETNDLTKAVHFCVENAKTGITILGATGKREDHSIGNTSLLVNYAEIANVQMITDYGVFHALLQSEEFESYAGQQVSIFSLTPDTAFTFHGLKYPLTGHRLSSWWQGSLNEACGNSFRIDMDKGKALVFREHKKVSG
jgi:thiamine pyrophosphokinase